ncbi:MAG TPA: alkaline phosphatase family protein [Mycobacteriales bacterium]|nr:alkaline phosphatase family protein [Mycobacteriales bacterium]
MAPRRRLALLSTALLVLGTGAAASARPPAVPRFSHVVYVVLENMNASATFEASPTLKALRRKGVYVPGFWAEGHNSLSNYEAMFAGVEPTSQGKADCLGMPYGSCVFPASVPTIATLLDAKRLPWKVYSEGMDGAPLGGSCLHSPSRLLPDLYQGPLTNGYATRHNPAPWFDSILSKGTGESYCKAHSVDLTQLWKDASTPRTLPAFSFVEPDTCHDGHDTQALGGCTLDPEGPTYPPGLGAIEAWLPGFVKRLTSSRAWDRDSLLVITFDEAAATDTSGCAPCHDTSAGGRIGTLLISPRLARPGSVSSWKGDHYGLLRTWEVSWGLPTLKSRAADAAAARLVHDGDPGVRPLTGIWR